jgi:hypothetical protein
MAAWPTLDQLKIRLDIVDDQSDDDLDDTLAAAIVATKNDVGVWDEMTDTPDESLSRAALRMAELLWIRPEPNRDSRHDPTYYRLLGGHRKAFPIS